MRPRMIKERAVGKRRMVLLLMALMGFLTVFGSPIGAAENRDNAGENEVLAIGTSRIIKGNLASAKDRAISQALVKGVENYLFQHLGSAGMINHFPRLIKEVIPNAEEKVEHFNILGEAETGDDYKVLVRARINEKMMQETLREAGVVLVEGPSLKVLFMVSEKVNGVVSWWWRDPGLETALSPTELVLYSVFQERGFVPINRALALPEAEFPEAMRSHDLGKEEVLRWGNLFSAEVVISGQMERVGEETLSLSLKAFDVGQGVQTAQGLQSEPLDRGPDGQPRPMESLKRLVNNLAAEMIPAVVQIAVAGRTEIHHLDITLTGLKSYRQLKDFKEFLKQDVAGVKSVVQTRLRTDSITLRVEFEGDMNRFLDRALTHEKLPFPVSITRTGEGQAVLSTGIGRRVAP